jgi:N-acylneuraminate cytidylyltransferase
MSSSPRVLAVIPARAGSKGIPGKNLREVAGRSLVARSVAVARAARTVDEVVVSTDGDAIAAEAVTAGARVVRRPVELAGDEASSESALLHALDAFSDNADTDAGMPEVLVFLQATSPFTDPVDIDRAVERVLSGAADAVLAAAPSHAFLWRTATDGSAVAVNHDAATRPRRQDRDPEYRETGAFYALRVDGFRTARHRFFGRVELAVVPARTAIDIDDVHDLDLAAALAPLVEPTTEQDPTERTAAAPPSVPTEPGPTEHDPTDPHPARTPAAENGAP